EFDGRRWDAFVAPAGGPLRQLVSPREPLAWADARPILEQTARELTAAQADGTLPAILTLDQVWVQPDGRVQLLDSPLELSAEAGLVSLDLVRQATALALEGAPRPPDALAWPIRAPLPGHAERMLGRLMTAS